MCDEPHASLRRLPLPVIRPAERPRARGALSCGWCWDSAEAPHRLERNREATAMFGLNELEIARSFETAVAPRGDVQVELPACGGGARHLGMPGLHSRGVPSANVDDWLRREERCLYLQEARAMQQEVHL